MTPFDKFKMARDWADANKSDPFAYSVALSHFNNGICSNTKDGDPGVYHAEAYAVERHLPKGMALSNGDTKFTATEFKNMKRP